MDHFERRHVTARSELNPPFRPLFRLQLNFSECGWKCQGYNFNVFSIKIHPNKSMVIYYFYSLNIYSFLLDIVCYHSSMITNHCFLSLFRLIHRMCRVGYPPNLFSEPAKLLNTEDTQLIMNPSYVRVTLSNYLVERFSFLLLRSV